jgi:hypothetical protein
VDIAKMLPLSIAIYEPNAGDSLQQNHKRRHLGKGKGDRSRCGGRLSHLAETRRAMPFWNGGHAGETGGAEK